MSEHADNMDKMIEDAEKALAEARLPARLRMNISPGDGYEDYLTEVEALVRAPLVNAYQWRLDQLKAMKLFSKDGDGDNVQT